MYDYPDLPDVVEDGATFAPMHLKAKAVGDALGLPVLADDSGLCVDALNGAPAFIPPGMPASTARMRTITRSAQ